MRPVLVFVAVLLGVNIAVAVDAWVEVDAETCVGIASRLQATSNVVVRKDTMKVINLFRLVLVRWILSMSWIILSGSCYVYFKADPKPVIRMLKPYPQLAFDRNFFRF
jgi:hypothetical protein